MNVRWVLHERVAVELAFVPPNFLVQFVAVQIGSSRGQTPRTNIERAKIEPRRQHRVDVLQARCCAASRRETLQVFTNRSHTARVTTILLCSNDVRAYHTPIDHVHTKFA
jgi:hypothetical protein